jgi:cell division protein FtsQ
MDRMALGRTRKSQSYIQFSWLQGIKYSLLILFLLAGIFSVDKMREANQFPIRHVKVYGVKHLDQEEMQYLLTPLVSKGFFAVEIEFIKERIMQMPWVADVSVRRIWPDQILIAVSERTPVARWNEMSLLSSSGEVFSPDTTTFPKSLPHFVGPEGEQIHMLQVYTKIDHILQPLHLKVTQLELTPYLSWNLVVAEGMKVRVGYKDILTRINHFVKVYQKIVGARAADVDYVDLRYPNGLAVRWKTVS